ncbi:hypothetical protein ACHAWF_012428 [Thalassiosira exigua]
MSMSMRTSRPSSSPTERPCPRPRAALSSPLLLLLLRLVALGAALAADGGDVLDGAASSSPPGSGEERAAPPPTSGADGASPPSSEGAAAVVDDDAGATSEASFDLRDDDGVDDAPPPSDADDAREEGPSPSLPPRRFRLAGHVQTDLRTGTSHFLSSADGSLDESFANLPFLECGAAGSATEGLPLVSCPLGVQGKPASQVKIWPLPIEPRGGLEEDEEAPWLDSKLRFVPHGLSVAERGRVSSPHFDTTNRCGFAPALDKECWAADRTVAKEQRIYDGWGYRSIEPEERIGLVSGVFRHVPHAAVIPERDVIDVVLDELAGTTWGSDAGGGSGSAVRAPVEESGGAADSDGGAATVVKGSGDEGRPRRPTPPKYVVALSPMEIVAGGSTNGTADNETRAFEPGDVVFVEDTWWGEWDDEEDADDGSSAAEGKMKGYVMRAKTGSTEDLNVLMLTVPDTIHRRWKNAQYHAAVARREERRRRQQQRQKQTQRLSPSFWNWNAAEGLKRPWWNPAPFVGAGTRDSTPPPPEPCSLESDPSFARHSPSSSRPRVAFSEHFARHFASRLRDAADPGHRGSFLPSHGYRDLLLPVLAQTAAALGGGAVSLALVLRLWRSVPGPVAAGIGAAFLTGAGTWGIVRGGEELLEQYEAWAERRRVVAAMGEDRVGGREGATGAGDDKHEAFVAARDADGAAVQGS